MPERYSRRNAARELEMSVSTFDMLRRRRLIREIRQGNRVYFPRAEIERVALMNLPAIWPAKQNGKTTRHFAPVKVELIPGKDDSRSAAVNTPLMPSHGAGCDIKDDTGE